MAVGRIYCLDGADASTARTKRADNQIAGLASKGCTVWNMALANMHSLPQETTDRKAGCGKSARPVWREGWSSNLHPYPYFIGPNGPTMFLFVFQWRGEHAPTLRRHQPAPLKNKNNGATVAGSL